MAEIEKTCENCKYEYEDMEGTHCRHCIHSAEERFEPKVIVPTEAEIRAKAIDEFAEKLKKIIEKDLANPDLMLDCKKCGIWKAKDIDEIAEQMKGGGNDVETN